MSVDYFLPHFGYACFLLNFLFPSVDCSICCAFVNKLIIFNKIPERISDIGYRFFKKVFIFSSSFLSTISVDEYIGKSKINRYPISDIPSHSIHYDLLSPLSLNHPLISIIFTNGSAMDTTMDPQETSQHVRYSFNHHLTYHRQVTDVIPIGFVGSNECSRVCISSVHFSCGYLA